MRTFEKLASGAVVAATMAALVSTVLPYAMTRWQTKQMQKSPKIINEYHLDNVIAREIKAKYSGTNKIIIGLYNEKDAGWSWKLAENAYIVEVGGRGANEYIVKHELNHIFAGDDDKLAYVINTKKGKLLYKFWYEPKTIAHEILESKF
jgi:hypothetical protein